MVSKKDTRLLHFAYSIAGLSHCRYKFGCVLVKGSRIISTGVNIRKTHPIFDRYGEYCVSMHAEYHAIMRCACTLHGAVAYIARYGMMKASKPCAICLELFQEHGIKAIVYHTGTAIHKDYL
jgi:deoxycytidylate deaminase